MSTASDPLLAIPRHELIAAALELGIANPERLDQSELGEAVRTASEGGGQVEAPKKASWLGVARHLVANVVEQGLNLPEAARVLRRISERPPSRQRPPLPTVTLAQIYLAQGHQDKARSTLELVLQRQSDNTKAHTLLKGLAAKSPTGESVAGEPPDAAAEGAPAEGAPAEGAPGHSPEQAARGVAADTDQKASSSPAPAVSGTTRAPMESHPAPEWEPQLDQLVVLLPPEPTTLSSGPRIGHVCWELNQSSNKLAQLGLIQVVLRLFTPVSGGCRTTERNFAVLNANGTKPFELEAGEVARAALISSQGARPLVLAVASEHELKTPGMPSQVWAPRAVQDDTSAAKRAAQQLEEISRN